MAAGRMGPIVKGTVLMVVWYAASGVHNAWTRESFVPFATGLALLVLASSVVQLVVSSVGGAAVLARSVSLDVIKREMRASAFWLLGLLHFLATAITNAAYVGASVAMAQSIKALEPLFVLVLAWTFIGRPKQSSAAATEAIAICTLCAGVMLLVRPPPSAEDGLHEWVLPLTFGMLSNLVDAVRSIFFKRVSGDFEGGAAGASCLMNVTATIIGIPLLLFALPFVSAEACRSIVDGRFLALSLGAGINLFLYNHAAFMILAYMSATSHAVLKTLKRPVIVAVMLMLPGGGSQLAGTQTHHLVAGVALLFAGAALQGQVALQEQTATNMLPSITASAPKSRAAYVGLAVPISLILAAAMLLLAPPPMFR